MAATDGVGPQLAIDPTLADTIAAWSDGGHWAIAFDDQWHAVAQTVEAAAGLDNVVGAFHFGQEAFDQHVGGNTPEEHREALRHLGGWMLADLFGREALREMLHPDLRDLVDGLEPCDSTSDLVEIPTTHFGGSIGLTTVHSNVFETRRAGRRDTASASRRSA